MSDEINTNDFDTVISSESRLFSLNLKEVFEYRNLIWMYTKKSFQLTYKQTVLGPLWIFLTPLITSLIYALVFGVIAGISTEGAPKILFYLGGTAVWTFFSFSLAKTAVTFTSNARVFGKVYFPRLTVPISVILFSAVNFFIQMIMFLAVWAFYVFSGAVEPNYYALPLLIPVLLQLGCLALGCGIIVSSLTTKYRDLAVLITFGVQLWMFITPVVYPISSVADSAMRTVLMMNPVSCSVEAFRYVFLGQGMVEPGLWVIACVVSIAILLVGVILFNRAEKTFTDTV